MRIIAGKFRRRRLLASPGDVTRPITDRVKESLFESIEQRLVGRRIADVFAGTGTLGLEALSRGASKTLFIEKDKVAVSLLRENIAALECGGDCTVWQADAYRCSFKPRERTPGEFSPFDVAFFDPPYRRVSELKTESPLWRSLRQLGREDVSSPDATLVLRAPERSEFDLPDVWKVEWTLTMSNMAIYVCGKSPSEDAAADADI